MPDRDDDLNLPEPLRRGLVDLYAPARGMNGRDEAILAAARQAAAGGGWRIHARRLVPLGLAAAVALATGLLWRHYSNVTTVNGGGAYARTGDIRDAYFLARQLQAGGTGKALESRWDTNGDGVVDEIDVHALALAAVKISGKGVQ